MPAPFIFVLVGELLLDEVISSVTKAVGENIYKNQLMSLPSSKLHTQNDVSIYIEQKKKELAKLKAKRDKFIKKNPGNMNSNTQEKVDDYNFDINTLELQLKGAIKRQQELLNDPNEIEKKTKPILTRVTNEIDDLIKRAREKINNSKVLLNQITTNLNNGIKIDGIGHKGLFIGDLNSNEKIRNELIGDRVLSLEQNRNGLKRKLEHNSSGNTYVTNNIINPIDSNIFRQKLGNAENGNIIKAHNSANAKYNGRI
jgi:hypothetical protein